MSIKTASVARTLATIGASVFAAGLLGQATAAAAPRAADNARDTVARLVLQLNANPKDQSLYTHSCWAKAMPWKNSAYLGVPTDIQPEVYIDGNDATATFIQGVIPMNEHWVLVNGHWLFAC
jgi:hypothetical protein